MTTDISLNACQVADVLDGLGLRDQVARMSLPPLMSGDRIAGRTLTVQFVPAEDDSETPYDDMIELIDSIEPGDVVVIATDGDLRTAYWGELFSAAAKGRGAVRIVTDGCIRDTDRIKALDFSVFAAAHRPIDYRARMRVDSVRGPVRIGDVVIRTGDVVVADGDGVVVVPADAWDEVVQGASIRRATENVVLEELLSGATLRFVWDKYRTL